MVANALDFATTQGRMKFTRPLYKELFKSPMARQLALDTFQAHAACYHPICRKMVAADLGLKLGPDGALLTAGGAAGEAGGGLGGSQAGGAGGGKGRGAGLWWSSSPPAARAALVVGVLAAAAGVAVVALRASKKGR